MNYLIIVAGLIFAGLTIGCENANSQSDHHHMQSEIEFKDSIHFHLAQHYIATNGKHERLSMSAIVGDTSLMVDYFTLTRNGWEIIKDHSNRIYFSFNAISYGNILLDVDSVRVETNYLGPNIEIDLTRDVVWPIIKMYNELLREVMQE